MSEVGYWMLKIPKPRRILRRLGKVLIWFRRNIRFWLPFAYIIAGGVVTLFYDSSGVIGYFFGVVYSVMAISQYFIWRDDC